VGAGQLDQGMEVLTKPFTALELERRVGELFAAQTQVLSGAI
jgi:hypothetical protein